MTDTIRAGAEPSDTAGSYLDQWLAQLSERDMPVMDMTVQRLINVAGDRDTSANDLAQVVLSDAAMTSGVIRVANSAYYNSAAQSISTISRAVIMLGFETVRAIGTSVAVIESFVGPRPRRHVTELMRQAVYTAVQAKIMAEAAGDKQPEEVFIAALLSRIGELAFWAYASEAQVDALEEALNEPGKPRHLIEKEVLGFSFDELTAQLAREWNLGELIQDVVAARSPRNGSRAASVRLGQSLERVVREHGWDSAEMRNLAKRVSAHTGLSPKRTKALIEQSEHELERAGEAFGVIIDPDNADKAAQAAAKGKQPQDGEEDQPGPEPSPELQLKILRELAQVLRGEPSLQTVLDMVLEGIYRGVGMDRTLVAIYNRDRKRMSVRYTLGDSGRLREAFNAGIDDARFAVFREALSRKEPIWTARLTEMQCKQWLTPAVRQTFASGFYVAPILARGRDIGLIYADRKTSRRQLDEEGYEAFCHFAEQANQAIKVISGG